MIQCLKELCYAVGILSRPVSPEMVEYYGYKTQVQNWASHLQIRRANLELERELFVNDPSETNRINWEVSVELVEEAERRLAEANREFYAHQKRAWKQLA